MHQAMGTRAGSFRFSRKKGLRIRASVCFVVLITLSTSCFHPRGAWVYRPSSYPAAVQPALRKRLVVLPFKDSRSNGNRTRLFLPPAYLIPLIPYGWADYSRPESPEAVKIEDAWFGRCDAFANCDTVPWALSPEVDFAEAAAEELSASGLFKEVSFSEEASDRDLILRGEVKSTRYLAKQYYYGMGLLFLLPALAGAPIGRVSNQLAIEFVLEERVSGASLWHKSYQETKDATFFLYWMPPEFYYDKLFEIIMRDVVKSIQAELPAMLSTVTKDDALSSGSSSAN
jgi:hypothetical protein